VIALRKTLPLLLACAIYACSGSSNSSTSPTTTTTTTVTVTAPTADSPADGAQLDNVRPTLTVVNSPAGSGGTKSYEFEVSDKPDTGKNNAFLTATVLSPTVSEDPSGKTKFTVGQDLATTTKYYWHARLLQGGSTSDWSPARSFNTKIAGYNKPGQLFDPLVDGTTVGTISGSKNITWMPGQGIRINDETAYVIYELPQTYSSGEMSAQVTGLNADGPCCKPRIFSMLDRDGQIASNSPYSWNVQYRGAGGAPANTITFKAILGDNAHSVEAADRFANIYNLDPSKVYLFQAFWTPTTFRVTVRENGLTGSVVYDELANGTDCACNWNPGRMYAYIGTNNGLYVQYDGSRSGMTMRNVWVGSTPRPATLGSAISATR
jgi:hypothetical protein